MSRRERLYHLHDILRQRRTPISRQDLMVELDCSQATLYRLVAELRDRLGAPLEQDDDGRGYYYDPQSGRQLRAAGAVDQSGRTPGAADRSPCAGQCAAGSAGRRTRRRPGTYQSTCLIARAWISRPSPSASRFATMPGGRCRANCLKPYYKALVPGAADCNFTTMVAAAMT